MAARDSTLYVPSGSAIRAISADDGSDVWTYTLSQPGYVVSMPTVGTDGTIYVPTYGGGLNAARLIAVSPNGTEIWSYPTNSDSAGLASVGQDGVVYFGDGLGILRSLDPDGSLRWSVQPSTRTYSQLILGANDVGYVGMGNGKYCAVQLNGVLLWCYQGDVNSKGRFPRMNQTYAVGTTGSSTRPRT